MLIKKEIFKKIGGFDEDYFAYFEDVDLCWRAWLYGYKVIYVPTSIVYHKLGGSWGGYHSYFRVYYSVRNRFFNIIKNFEIKRLLIGLIISLIFDIFKMLVFIYRLQGVNILAILKANIDALKKLRIMVRKRMIVQSNRCLKDKDLIDMNFLMSITESIKEYIRLHRLLC